MQQGPIFHPGWQAVRTLLDSFTFTGPHGEHVFGAQAAMGKHWNTYYAQLSNSTEHSNHGDNANATAPSTWLRPQVQGYSHKSARLFYYLVSRVS